MLMEGLELLERQQKATVPTCLGWLTQIIYRYVDKYISNEGIAPVVEENPEENCGQQS